MIQLIQLVLVKKIRVADILTISSATNWCGFYELEVPQYYTVHNAISEIVGVSKNFINISARC